MMNWERYGLRIGVSEGSLSFEETAEAAVVALVGGQFVFPANTVLVSAVYAVSLSRPLLKPLRLEIQHCVHITKKVQTKYLKFSIAPVDTPSLPYQFSIIEGGEFSVGERYGSINREKFCLVSIVGISTNGVEGEEQQQEGEEGGDQNGGGGQEEGGQHGGGEGDQNGSGGGQVHEEGGGQQGGGMYSNSKKKLMINKKRKMADKDNSKMLRLKDSSQNEVKVSEILIIIMSIY